MMTVPFALFAAVIIFTLYLGLPMSLAMSAGFVIFLCTGLHRGFSLASLLRMFVKGAKSSLIVVRVLLTIGILTGLWRSAGTFAVLTSWGLRTITPSMFILASFMLPCILSYALGTSFGTAGTLGIALMTLARSGGVSPILTAGAVMSGIHFGDRGSPASSCAHLVASLTGTDIYANVKAMMRTAILPLILSATFYAVLSLRNPLASFSSSTLNELSEAFNLNIIAASPAVLMLVLPLFRVNIFIAFLVSIAAAFACTVCIQGYSLIDAAGFAVFGLHAESGIKMLFNGGGLLSMVQTCLVLIISGTFSGIFDGTGMLEGLQDRISALMRRFGAYPVMLAIGTAANAVFCNQTAGVIMTVQLMKKPYEHEGIASDRLALDLSDSTVITAPLVPWCIACSVPLAMLGVNISALVYAFYLYLIPVCSLTARKNLPHNNGRQ